MKIYLLYLRVVKIKTVCVECDLDSICCPAAPASEPELLLVPASQEGLVRLRHIVKGLLCANTDRNIVSRSIIGQEQPMPIQN